MRLRIRVKPKSGEDSISLDGETVLVSVREAPERGAANTAVLKLIRKKLGMQARLVHGMSSRNKTVEIPGNEAEIMKKIANLMDSEKQRG